MQSYIYETHRLPDPLLPFIFHRSFSITRENAALNWHENIELLWCIGGSGYVRRGAQTVPFTKGDIFVVNADTPHTVCSAGEVTYRCLIVDNSFFLQNGIPVNALHFQELGRETDLFSLLEAVSQAYSDYAADKLCAAADIRYAVLGVLRKLCSCRATDPQPQPSFNPHVKKAILYIRSHFSESISLDALAAEVGISKYHLCREFKAYTGSSIVSAINLLRCTAAKELIENGAGIQAAAADCGFENLSYFSRTFKKLMGILPSKLTVN